MRLVSELRHSASEHDAQIAAAKTYTHTRTPPASRWPAPTATMAKPHSTNTRSCFAACPRIP
jgi:hypothetical protein